MPFKKGHKINVGRKNPNAGEKPGFKTQIRRWEEEHPNAYAEMMDVLMALGKGNDKDAATYIIDRIRGRPHQSIDSHIRGEFIVSPVDYLRESTKVFEVDESKTLELLKEYNKKETNQIEEENGTQGRG